MPAEPLNRLVRVLLLDSAWPYDTSANLLRLHVLRQFLRRLQAEGGGDTTAELFEAFDLVVARNSPFIGRFCQRLNSSPLSRFCDPVEDTICEAEDLPFKGFRLHPRQGTHLPFFYGSLAAS